ncbi:MAG: hypothetical protein JWR75_1844 [Devosia sp.]|nr:hypothetical protein [Devosia sp.]
MPAPLSSPRVSVIIPALNAVATLGRTLASVVGQTERQFEVIVIDDGSSDETADLARSFSDRLPGLQVISQPRRGTGAARNAGLALARGTYIAPLDADDLWHPTYLRQLADRLDAAGPGTVMAYAFHRRIDAADCVIVTPRTAAIEGFGFYRMAWWNVVGNGSGMLARRDSLRAIGGFAEDPLINNDYYPQLRLCWLGGVTTVPSYLVGYRSVPGTQSRDLVNQTRRGLRSVRQAVAETGADEQRQIRRTIAARAGFAMRAAVNAKDFRAMAAFAPLGVANGFGTFLGTALGSNQGKAYGLVHHQPGLDRFLELDPKVPDGRVLGDSFATRALRHAEAADRREAGRRGLT